jgi:SAM-dependent methyltransferase
MTQVNISWDSTTTKRTHLINAIAEKISAKSYLEIGCAGDDNFGAVNIAYKVGVDPMAGGTHRMTSDFYFENYTTDKFDIIFIDGLHHADQVVRDIDNSLNYLNEGGVIVMHDCLPTDAHMQTVPIPAQIVTWTGDVWKAVFHRHDLQEVDICIATIDLGCGVIVKRPPKLGKINENANFWITDATFQDYANNYSKLNLLTFGEAVDWV